MEGNTSRLTPSQMVRKPWYRYLMTTAWEWAWEVDPDGCFVYSNQVSEKALGIPPEELLGKSLVDFILPDELIHTLSCLRRTAAGEEADCPQQISLRHKDGTVGIFATTFRHYRDENGNNGCHAISHDLNRQAAVDELWDSPTARRIIPETPDCGVMLVDHDGYIRIINGQLPEIWGNTPAATILDSLIFEWLAPEARGLQIEQHRSRMEGRLMNDTVELPIVIGPEELLWLKLTSTVILDRHGAPWAIMCCEKGNEQKPATEAGGEVTSDEVTDGADRMLLEYQGRLQALAAELALTEERERRKIATVLTDEVCTALEMSCVKLDTLPNELFHEEDREIVTGTQQIIRTCIEVINSLTLQISPPILYEAGLEAALQWLCGNFLSEHGLEVAFFDDRQPKPLPVERRFTAFHAARELLLNVALHAHTNQASLTISREGKYILLIVEDKGIGFDSSILHRTVENDGRFGVFNIRQRIKHCWGDFVLDTTPGEGTRATVRIPVAEGF